MTEGQANVDVVSEDIVLNYMIRTYADKSVMFRTTKMIPGVWHPAKSRVDVLAHYLRSTMAQFEDLGIIEAMFRMGIPYTNVTRVRNGLVKMPYDWPLRIHDATGLPIHVIRDFLGNHPEKENGR